MSHRQSRSQFATDGHEKFQNARKPQLAPSVRKHKLAMAESSYRKCLEYSKTLDEKATSYKYLGHLFLWAAKDAAEDVWNYGKAGVVVDTAESVDKQNEVKERLKKCVEYLLKAKESQLCVNGVENWVRDIITWSSKYLDAYPASFTPVMTVICKAFETSEWGTECYLNFAVSIFERGTKCLETESSSSKVPGQGGYMECMKAMRECENFLQLPCIENIGLEGRVSDLEGRVSDLERRVSNLKRGVQRYLGDCEAIQHSINGEGYLEQGMILEAIKSFTSAVDTGDSPEYRAFAYSRLGKLHCFLEDESKAHYNHERSVEIARRKLSPRVESAEWYIYSCEAVEKHRLMEETRELTALEKAATKNLMPYIEYLFKNLPHPNKKPERTSSKGPLSENTDLAAKKTAWSEAVRIYHPDKNNQESEHWQRLCNVIMKELNKKKPMKKDK